jgi:hypothetical protein
VSFKIVPAVKTINKNNIIEEFNSLFKFVDSTFECDLLNDNNYKLDIPKPASIESIKSINYTDNSKIDIINLTHNIPDEFKFCEGRNSYHFINSKALIDNKILILRDSSTNLLLPYLHILFTDIFLYWDHYKPINNKLIEYYKPDYIFEIRTERFLNI